MAILKQEKKLTQWAVTPHAMSPPSARNLGAIFGTGKYLFFFDNHCIPEKDYFSRAIEKMEQYNIDMLHSTYAVSLP
jgi:hypothetical protein